MLISKKRILVIGSLDDLLNLGLEEVSRIAKEEEANELEYILPEGITDLRDMTIHKGGFLKEILSALYPNKKKYEINNIIRTRYQVFLCDKQMYRNHKYYNS